MDIKPDNVGCRIFLARVLNARGEEQKSRLLFERLLYEGVSDFHVFRELAEMEVRAGNFAAAEGLFLQGVERLDAGGFCELSMYLRTGLVSLFENAMNDPARALRTVQAFQGDPRIPDEQRLTLAEDRLRLLRKLKRPLSSEEVGVVRATNYWENTSFQRNFRQIVAHFQTRGTVVVVMQYPRLPVAPLREILKDFSGVMYAENVENFDHALRELRFEDVFSDQFGVRFGHFRPPGARLVARAAAQAVRAAIKVGPSSPERPAR